MKRLFIAILITLLLAAALAAAIAYDPGYVLIAFGNYTLETTAWVGLALLLALLLVMFLVVVIVHRSVRQGSLFGRWRGNWRERRGRQLTQRGLLAYLEGNYERARVVLDRAASSAEAPALNYLLAARAAAVQGEYRLAEQYLLRAQRNGEADTALTLTHAELQLRQGKPQEALAALTRLRNHAPKHPQLLKLLQETYQSLRDWRQLLQLLPQLRKQKLLSRDAAADLEARASANLLDDLTAQQQLENLRRQWQELPRAVTRESRVVASYARGLIALGAGADAEPVLRSQLARDWNEQLLALYGVAPGAEPARQLAQAEQWLRQYGGSAALWLSLGRIAMRNQLWGKAREYFESSLKLEERAETCAELGRLLAQLGQHDRSSEYYARGIALQVPTGAAPRTAQLRIIT